MTEDLGQVPRACYELGIIVSRYLDESNLFLGHIRRESLAQRIKSRLDVIPEKLRSEFVNYLLEELLYSASKLPDRSKQFLAADAVALLGDYNIEPGDKLRERMSSYARGENELGARQDPHTGRNLSVGGMDFPSAR